MKRMELISTIAEHPDWTMQQLGDHFGVTKQAVDTMLRIMRGRGIDYGYVSKREGGTIKPCGGRHRTCDYRCEGCGWLTREQRFWARVNFEGECWLWEGSTRAGYGADSTRYAHQEAYKYAYGPIPEGKYVLHTCDVRLCVNPDHLLAGTQTENINGNPARGLNPRKPRLRGTHCRGGHEFTEENTYYYNDGKSRRCKSCARERHRQKAARLESVLSSV